jgi:tRNA pseudouridine13 synthase
MARGCFDQLLEGDVAKKTDTGGIFTVEDPAAETPRLRAWEITYTGPIYGAKMRWAQGPAGERERELLAAQDVEQAMLKRARLKGGRRPARLRLDDIGLERTDQGLMFSFALPKGAYATTVLRELMKNPEAPRSGEAS